MAGFGQEEAADRPAFEQSSLVAQRIKYLPAMQETWVQSLGWEDPLEKGMATVSSILVHGQRRLAGYSPVQRVGHD